MSRRNPPAQYVLPSVVNPASRKCYTILVPDEPQHIAAFNGAILSLASAYNWADDPDHTAKDVALVWREVWEQMAACGTSFPYACPYDFTADNGGWALVIDGNLSPDHRGAYAFPTGWYATRFHQNVDNDECRGIRIKKTFPSPQLVSQVTMEYDLIKGTIVNAGFRNGVLGYLSGALQFSSLVQSNTDPDGFSKFLISTPGGISVDEIQLVITCGQQAGSSDPGGQATIRYCQIVGDGSYHC